MRSVWYGCWGTRQRDHTAPSQLPAGDKVTGGGEITGLTGSAGNRALQVSGATFNVGATYWRGATASLPCGECRPWGAAAGGL